MTTSLKTELPAGYDPSQGIKNLRVRDRPPISVRSMTALVSADLHAPDMNVGHVYATKVVLRVWGDGNWWFGGHLDDTSVVFGDNYAIGFSFEDGGFAGVATGELGADATRTPQHITFAIAGRPRSEGLQRNFNQVLGGGVKFRLHQSADLGQAFSDLGDDLKWLGQRIELMASYDSSRQGADGPPNEPPPDGGAGGGGGENGGV